MRRLRNALMVLVGAAALLLARADSGTLYTPEGGLSSGKTTCLVQDRYGFLWVGTEYGLNRFDGYRYTTYLPQRGDTTSLPSAEVTAFLADRQGRLWVGCDKGLARYRHQTNDFQRYRISKTVTPRIESIVETAQGDIVVGTAGYGIFVIRHGQDKPQRLHDYTRNSADEFASRLHIDRHGQLWRGSHQPLLTRTRIGNNLKPSHFRDYPLTAPGPAVDYVDAPGGLLVVCMYGLLRYNSATGTLADAGYDLSLISGKASIRAALLAADGTLYIGTSGQGVFMAPKGQRRLTPMENHSTQFDLGKANVNDIIQDKDGNLWVSCYNKGAYLLSTKRTAFFTQTFTAQDVRLGSSVSSVAPADDGGKWVTVQKSGIYHFDRTGRITAQRTQPEGANTIYRDRDGRYWLGTENALYAYDVATGSATLKLRLDGWGVNCMVQADGNNLVVSNFGKGIVVYNTLSGQTTALSMNASGRLSLPNDWVKAMLFTRGICWLATADGLACADSNDIFAELPAFRGKHCLSLCEWAQGDILVGTDEGLYIVNDHTRQVRPFPRSDELGTTSVYGIVVDRYGDVWISTAMGIWQYDHNARHWLGHIGGSGLATREYVVGAALHDDTTDDVCFGIGDGITTFLPDFVRQSAKTVGSPRLTRIAAGGREEGVTASKYTVDYQDNTLTLEFSMLNFQDIDNVTYEYRLSDREPWTILPDGGNQLTLNKLEPGTYQLEVRATNGGSHSQQPLRLTLCVRHPWYGTPLAWVCYVFLALALVVFTIYYIERRRNILVEEAKMRFLINATHDIRSPLTLILGPLEKLKQRLGDTESQQDIDTIDRNAQRLLLLVNQILDERRIDKRQLRLRCQPTDLVKQVEGVSSMYQYNAHQRGISLTISHQAPAIEVWIDRTEFDKVLANLLSNAFKYTLDGGQIAFTLDRTDTHARLRLTDSGPGLREQKPDRLFERFYQGRNAQTLHVEGTGIGLNLSRAIVMLHGGTITAYNRTDGQQGATFEVMLPLGRDHLDASQLLDEQEQAAAAQPSAPRHAPHRRQRVMVVDDDHELARYVAAELATWFHTETFDNGQAALDALLTSHYDLVVSDVVMPQMDGLELLRRIKTNPRLSDTPVILLTSKSETDHRVEGLRKGADGYIGKPFQMEELRAMAVNLIDNVNRLRGKFSGAQQQEERREHIEAKGNDDALMERIMRSLNAHLSEPDFRVDSLTQDVGISRAQLHRKLKEITGLPAGEFIRNLRLDEAARLLREGKLTVTQIAYTVGFTSQSHFSTLFHRRFGQTPKDYAESQK